MPKGRVYKTKSKGAQEAHESIRPTSFRRDPDSVAGSLKPDELRLYRLIWQRALASQMAPKELETTTIELADGAYELRASATKVLFDGFARGLHRGPRRRRDRRGRRDRAAAGAGRGRPDDGRGGHADPALHRAAAALHRGDAHQGARGARDRPAVDLCRDDLDDHRPRLRPGRGAPAPSGARRRDRHRPPGRALRGLRRRRVHRPDGGGARRGRPRRARLGPAPAGVLRAAARPRRREAARAQAQRLHDRGDRRGLLARPPDGHPARSQRAGSWPARSTRSTRRAGRCPATSRRPRRGRARSAPSAARGRWSARAAGSGRSSAARATRTATTSRRTARRRPTRSRSRSPARRTTTATSCRAVPGGPGNVFWGCSNYPRCDFTTNHEPLGGLHDADDGPLARKDEAAICLKCGSTSDTPADAIVPGERYAGGPPNPEALARPARAPRRRRGPGATGARTGVAPVAPAEPRRRGDPLSSATAGRQARSPGRAGRRRVSGEPAGRTDRSRPRSRGSSAPSPRATPRRTPSGPTRRPSGRTSAGWPRAGRTGAARSAPTCAPISRSSAEGHARSSVAQRLAAIRSFHRWATRSDLAPGRPVGRDRDAAPAAPAAARSSRSSRSSGCSRSSRRTSSGCRATILIGRRCGWPWRCATGRSSRPPTPPGLRISELASAELGALDLRRGEVRVLGKGRKERIGLLGRPARRALADYLEDGRPVLLERRAGAGGAAGRDLPEPPRRAARRARPALPARSAVRAGRPARSASRRTRSGTRSRRTCSMAAPTCASSRSCSATRTSRRPRSTRTSRPVACRPPIGRPTRGRVATRRRERGRVPRPRRAHRLGRVPRLARPRLRPARRHRERVPAPRPSSTPSSPPSGSRTSSSSWSPPGRSRRRSSRSSRACSRPDEQGTRLAGRVDRHQPDAHRPGGPGGRPVRPRAGDRPVHHPGLRRRAARPDDRADPDHAAQPDLPRARGGRDERPQRGRPVRGVGDRPDRLQPRDHRRRAAPRSEPRGRRASP